MITARARVVERTPDGATSTRLAYELADGPDAGATFYASDRPWWLIGQAVTVTYHPQAQHAARAKEST